MSKKVGTCRLEVTAFVYNDQPHQLLATCKRCWWSLLDPEPDVLRELELHVQTHVREDLRHHEALVRAREEATRRAREERSRLAREERRALRQRGRRSLEGDH